MHYNPGGSGGTIIATMVFLGVGLLVIFLGFISKVLTLLHHANAWDLLWKVVGG